MRTSGERVITQVAYSPVTWLLVALSIATKGLGSLFVDVSHVGDPLLVTTILVFVAAVFITPVALVDRRHIASNTCRPGHLKAMLLAAPFNIALTATWYYAIHFGGAVSFELVQNTRIFFVAILSHLLIKTYVNRDQWLACAIIVLGSVLIQYHSVSSEYSWVAVSIQIGYCVGLSLYTALIESTCRVKADQTCFAYHVFQQHLFMLLLLAAGLLVREKGLVASLSAIPPAAWAGLLCRGLNDALFFMLMRRIDMLTRLLSSIPANLITLAAAAVIGHVVLTFQIYVGMALIVLGILSYLWHLQRATVNGFTLDDMRLSGLLNADSRIGIYAADPDSYEIFRGTFDPIIRACHSFDPDLDRHPMAPADAIPVPDLRDPRHLVRSIRLRIARNVVYRNVANSVFPSLIDARDRKYLEETLSRILVEEIPGGKYYAVADLPRVRRDWLLEEGLLFDNRSRFSTAAGIFRDWPDGRGVFISPGLESVVWINEEDHLRIFSVAFKPEETGLYVGKVFDVQAALRRRIEFAVHPVLGHLTCCPSNLGTGMRFSALVHLPGLGKAEALPGLCRELGLDVRGTSGEHSETREHLYDISNSVRLGLAEAEIVRRTMEGWQVVFDAEMAAGPPG